MDTRVHDSVQPQHLAWRADGGIEITFSDGHHGVYTRTWLRAMCPCATCAGTHGPPTTLVDAGEGGVLGEPEAKPKPKFAIAAGKRPPAVELSLRLDGAEPMGSYGMKLRWGDGHDTGIYTWRYLRSTSPGDGSAAHPPTPAALAARPRAVEELRRMAGAAADTPG